VSHSEADEWVELPMPETVQNGDVVVTAINRTQLQRLLDCAEAGESVLDMLLLDTKDAREIAARAEVERGNVTADDW
jgi:hypothetical protein